MIGREIGTLSTVTHKFKRIYGESPELAFDSERYLDWVNTQLPSGIILEVIRMEQEPFYLSRVYLTIDCEAIHYGEERQDDYNENYAHVENLLELTHSPPERLI